MNQTIGPKIIGMATDKELVAPLRETGIRRSRPGEWAAIREGRLIDVYRGPGSKLAAIRAAGTNAVIA